MFPEQVGEGLLRCREQETGFLVGVGGDDVDADHGVRRGQLFRRLEVVPVDLERPHQRVGSEVGGEGIGQAEHGGELGAEQAGAEDPQRHVGIGAGNRLEELAGLDWTQQGLKLEDVLGNLSELPGSRRSASSVRWSVPGARPRPRSIRSG